MNIENQQQSSASSEQLALFDDILLKSERTQCVMGLICKASQA